MLTLIHHTDPGHGWLQVPAVILRELNTIDKVSSYSYYCERTDTFFLEEDEDVSLIIEPLRAAGEDLFIEELYQDPSFVRSLPRWQPKEETT
tara:strand:- start:3024 stop:3299 length:276 start_codon:yes stop_codon:yes gene_type:complete